MSRARAPEWRIGRGWSDEELRERLLALRDRSRNITRADDAFQSAEFRHYFSEARIARERRGRPEPGGAFARAKVLVERYAFSDPRIVIAHFDPTAPLLGRRMLLEIQVHGLHYLCGVVVGNVRDETRDGRSVFGFRCDTLEGHLEAGSEWFLLTKDHRTGSIDFLIQAAWRSGEFPNLWSKIGFRLLVRRYQRAWHRLAHLRLRKLLDARGLPSLPTAGELLHEGHAIEALPLWAVTATEPVPALGVEVQS